MKSIGFIDHYIDEWHANMYPGWIRASAFKDRLDVAYAWEETAKQGGKALDAWCSEQKVSQADSQTQLIRKCDCIVVLSPDNPERHEELADKALRSGKPVYIDKTFAPSLAIAKRLFAKAEKYSTPMYSSSALRYSPDLRAALDGPMAGKKVKFAAMRGPGYFGNYAVHQVEPLVIALGLGATKIMQIGTEKSPVLAIDYDDGRRGMISFNSSYGFQMTAEYGEGETAVVDFKQDFWNGENGFIPNLLSFFESGKPAVKKEETLEIIAIIEAGAKAFAKPGAWVKVAAR